MKNINIKNKTIKALELYKDIFNEEKSHGSEITNHTTLKNGVGAYFSSEDCDTYAQIVYAGIIYNQYNGSVEVKFEESELFAIDFEKWIDTVMSVLKTNTKHEYKLLDFKLNTETVVTTNKVIDESIVKSRILDDLISRNVSFRK